nr:hypothetical protein [uncultured Achromobacter sp.]
MTYYAFVHSRSGLTRPVLAGEFKGRDQSDALNKASSSPAVKKIVGNQQTKDLYVRVYEARDYQGAVEQAMAVHTPWLRPSGDDDPGRTASFRIHTD